MLRELGRQAFKNTPLESPLWAIYNGLRQRWKIRSLRPQGWYTVTPSSKKIQGFKLYSDGFGEGERAKLRAEYEPEVTQCLLSHIGPNDVFWEVGSRYGYHTQFIAQIAQKVVAFEADSDAVSKLEEAVRRNGYDNVQVIEGMVGEDISLEDYQVPDVVLMDIEGWEQHVLEKVTRPLQADTTWIIEMHDKTVVEGEWTNPEAVISRFEAHNYTTSKISERKSGNFHLLAEPLSE